MLSPRAFDGWCQRLALGAEAQTLIAAIRTSPPARRVRNGAGNVIGSYPSRKMGQTVQFESHTVELPVIYDLEYDPEVLEYWDQPAAIPLTYLAHDGRRRVSVAHTPDFFVLHTASAGWEECKHSQALLSLADRSPHRYRRTEVGTWSCPPGEQYARGLGLTYRLRSSEEIAWDYPRNLVFLEDYLRADHLPIVPEAAEEIGRLVAGVPGLSLADLLQRVRWARADDVYMMIATGQVYVDLRSAPLAEPERVVVWRDSQVAHVARLLTTLPPVSAVPPAVSTPSTAATIRILRASPDALAQAVERYARIAPYLQGHTPDEPLAKRTRSRWLARYRQAAQADGCGFAGLLSAAHQRGNRTPRLNPEVHALMEEFIVREYETPLRKPPRGIYGRFVLACEAHGYVVPSDRTFYAAITRRRGYAQTVQRAGHRAAYGEKPPAPQSTSPWPRHGDRPWDLGHIDHTQLEIVLLCTHTGRVLGRPWVTFLVDADSRRVLALALTYDVPSYRSCLLALRACVQRHGRLPQTLVVDGGPEFKSTYFDVLLARYEITKKVRPPAEPRFGAICERLFGTTQTQLIHALAGNTQSTRTARQGTPAVDPARHACWTLGDLHEMLCRWAYEVYETLPHTGLEGRSPREVYHAHTAQSGERSHRTIPYDDTFRMLTLPTTAKTTAKVLPGRGVKIHHLLYWCDAFRHPTVEGTQVPVRYDPWDASTAYAYVRGQWERCVSEHAHVFQGRSERELALATTELRQRDRLRGRLATLTTRQLATFLLEVQEREDLLLQRLRDGATQAVASMQSNAPPQARTAVERNGSARGEDRVSETDPTADTPDTPREVLDVYGEYL